MIEKILIEYEETVEKMNDTIIDFQQTAIMLKLGNMFSALGTYQAFYEQDVLTFGSFKNYINTDKYPEYMLGRYDRIYCRMNELLEVMNTFYKNQNIKDV